MDSWSGSSVRGSVFDTGWSTPVIHTDHVKRDLSETGPFFLSLVIAVVQFVVDLARGRARTQRVPILLPKSLYNERLPQGLGPTLLPVAAAQPTIR